MHRKTVLLGGATISLIAILALVLTPDRLWYLPHNFLAAIVLLCLILALCVGFRAVLIDSNRGGR